jgi:Tfp pilus assembly protein PilO
MFWDNFSQKEKIGLIAGSLFMSFALLDRLMIGPINQKIKQADLQIKQNRRELAVEIHNASQKPALKEAYDKLVPQEEGKGTDEERIAGMLTAVEDLGRDSGSTLLDIKPQPTKNQGLFKQYSITVEAEGEMEKLVTFLYKVNHSKELLRVENLQLNLKDKEAKVLKASILISKVGIL